VPLFYVDSSALVKLVHREVETAALRTFLSDADVVSSELVVTELPRAIRRAGARDPGFPVDALIDRTGELLDTIALRQLDRPVLLAAGVLAEPSLRALDAIHVATAIDVFPHDGFVTYNERQSAAARLAGLRTFAPGG
jgi:predicted nucleic acid-binding protein